jgi:hypothetical protein
MSFTVALTETAADFSFGKSMLGILPKNKTPDFWESLSRAEQQGCIREDRPVNICGQTAWVTQGKVQKIWQDLIFPSIEKILATQEAKIFEPCDGRILAFDVNIYMRGSLERFRPTIVAFCMELIVAKMVVKFVKAHLKPHKLGFAYLAAKERIRLTMGDSSNINPFSSPLSACGVPISIRYDAGGSHNIKAATIGGCLRVGSKHYGLTAAHILFTDSTNDSEVPPSVDDASLEWGEVCSDISDLDMLEGSHSTPLQLSASLGLQENRQEYFWRSESREFQLSNDDPLLWDLVTPTRELENHELDWLLIPLERDDRLFENRVHFKGRDIHLYGVTDEEPDDVVILVAGQSGSRLLKASSTLGGIFIPSVRRLLRTWSVFHEVNSVTHGDSGSWAINESGQVYGFLVGTNEGSRVSYVAPMVTTIDAIRVQNPGAKVSFPIRHSRPDAEQRTLSAHGTERQLQSPVPLHATNAARTSIGRAAKAATVEPWLHTVHAQSVEPAPTDPLRPPRDADNEWPAEDAMSDVSVASYDVPIGSDIGENASSATSSMIFSVGNQSRNADDEFELASYDEDFELSHPDLQRVLSSLPTISGTSGDRERLDPKYHKRPDAERFFVAGRVFAYLSHETVEEGKDLGNVTYITGSKDGKKTLSRIRRLAVIRECDGYCIAIPIETYSSHLSEASKAHAFVYGSDTAPTTTKRGKDIMTKEAIAINLSGVEKTLDRLSRLDFGEAIIVRWDVKVANIGKVATESLSAFTRYALNTLENLQLRGDVTGDPTNASEPPHSDSPPEVPTLSRALGVTYIYDSEQGEMERIARQIP